MDGAQELQYFPAAETRSPLQIHQTLLFTVLTPSSSHLIGILLSSHSHSHTLVIRYLAHSIDIRLRSNALYRTL